MRKIAFYSLVLLSSLIALGAAGLWVRGYWINDTLEWVSHYRQRFISCGDGRVLLQINHGPWGNNEFEPLMHLAYAYRPGEKSEMGRSWRFAGFWLKNLAFAPSPAHSNWVPYTDIIVPLYAVIVAGMILPALAIRRSIRARRRVAGICAKCGYDLRATPQRCPECGTVPARPV